MTLLLMLLTQYGDNHYVHTPEPATWLMFGGGLAFLVGLAKYRKGQK